MPTLRLGVVVLITVLRGRTGVELSHLHFLTAVGMAPGYELTRGGALSSLPVRLSPAAMIMTMA